MFDYEMTYKNNRNETFIFGETSGLYLDSSKLFDYAWTVETAQRKIVSIRREPREIPVDLCYLTDADSADKINDFDTVIDYDVRIGKPGVLEFNGWTLHGIFVGSQASDYEWKKGIMRREMSFLTTDQDWTKKTLIHFRKKTVNSDSGMGYPHDYPHDYLARSVATGFENPSPFSSEFVLRYYGPITNPYVIISGNKYQVNVVLTDGEQVIIDSRDHTQVLKVSAYGETTNVFDQTLIGQPGSGFYPFELIKPGHNSIAMPFGAKFDIELYEGRSTPRWYDKSGSTEITIQGS